MSSFYNACGRCLQPKRNARRIKTRITKEGQHAWNLGNLVTILLISSVSQILCQIQKELISDLTCSIHLRSCEALRTDAQHNLVWKHCACFQERIKAGKAGCKTAKPNQTCKFCSFHKSEYGKHCMKTLLWIVFKCIFSSNPADSVTSRSNLVLGILALSCLHCCNSPACGKPQPQIQKGHKNHLLKCSHNFTLPPLKKSSWHG